MSIETRSYNVKPNTVIDSILLLIVSNIRFDLLPKSLKQGYLKFIKSDLYYLVYIVMVGLLIAIHLHKCGIL